MTHKISRFLLIISFWPIVAVGQGTLQINFNGPPLQPSGSDFNVQSYFESGMYFRPLPGTDGFGRAWSNQPPGIPDDGTPYLVAGEVDSLAFSFTSGSLFGVVSVDLAGFSIGAPDYTVNFIGYRSDGSTITTSFSGSGNDFQTFYFGSDWASGLTHVAIPNEPWSLDNLVVSVPEPGVGALFLASGITFAFSRIRRRRQL